MRTRITTSLLIAAALVTGSAGSASAAGVAPPAPVKLTPAVRAAVIADTPPAGPIITFAGKVAGTNAYVSVVSRGGQVEAYVCDSDKIAVWLKGTLARRVASAANATNEVVLNAKQSGSTLTGTVTLAGKSHNIKATAVSWPSGLYEAWGLSGTKVVRAGWVLVPDGTQRGAKRVGVDVAPVNAVDPSAVGVDIGAGANSVAVPSTPVPFGKKVAVATKPPTLAEQCAKLEHDFNFQMGLINGNGPGDIAAGNAADQTYKQGEALKCPQFPNPNQTD